MRNGGKVVNWWPYWKENFHFIFSSSSQSYPLNFSNKPFIVLLTFLAYL